jgi:hypothetical protein
MISIPHNTVISYFDVHEGPRILMSDAKSKETESIPSNEITNMLDVHSPGDFFVHYYNNNITVNYCFAIKDNMTRGGEHLFMTSLIFKPQLYGNGSSSAQFASEIFLNLPDFERWVKGISNSVTKSELINYLSGMKSTRDLETQSSYIQVRNALIDTLIRRRA